MAKGKFFSSNPSPSSKLLVIIVMVSAILVSAALATYVFLKDRDGNLVNKSGYQAVFLENGQVYFGHLSNINDGYVRLTDIYYLQSSADVQKKSSKDEPQLQLNKLGNELHGPEDAMYISRSTVTFWENMKSDSKVVEAIKNNNK